MAKYISPRRIFGAPGRESRSLDPTVVGKDELVCMNCLKFIHIESAVNRKYR